MQKKLLMQPLNDFFTLRDWHATDDQLSCIVTYNAAHRIFEGHFPGNPIVPGVCTMEIVKQILEKAVPKKLLLSNAPTVKFLGLITPEIRPEVKITWTFSGPSLTANATLSDGDQTLFKMKATYIFEQ